MWQYWCKALGSKAYEDNRKADRVAIIRTGWVVLHIVTCLFIILNAIASHGWGRIMGRQKNLVSGLSKTIRITNCITIQK